MSRVGSSLRVRVVLPALVLQVGTWFAMLAHGSSWLDEWRNAVDQVAGTVVITGPLLAALVANEYARRGETALPASILSSVHPVRSWYQPVLTLVLLAWANLTVVVGSSALLTTAGGVPVFPAPLRVLPLSALLLAVHALVGMAIGVRLPTRLAGAVAGTVSFGLFLLAVAHLAPVSFGLAAVTEDLVGQDYRVSTLVGFGAVALVSGVAVGVMTIWDGPARRAWAGVGLVALLCSMLLSSHRFVDREDRFVAVPVELRCTGSAPRVCMPAEAPRALAAAARRMHELAAPLLGARAELPQRWVYFWGRSSVAPGGVLRAGIGSRVDDRDLTWSLTKPAFCPAYLDDSEPEMSFDARVLLQAWIGHRNGLGYGATDTPHPWFRSPESDAWVRTTYAQLRRCDLAAVRLPTG